MKIYSSQFPRARGDNFNVLILSHQMSKTKILRNKQFIEVELYT